MGRLLRERILRIKFINKTILLIKMTTAVIGYKAGLAIDYNSIMFEATPSVMEKIVADCPTVGKLFSKHGGTYLMPHSAHNLRTVVSELNRFGENYWLVSDEEYLVMVGNGTEAEHPEGKELIPESDYYAFAVPADGLRVLISYAMRAKQDIKITVDGPAAPAGKPQHSKQFHRKRIGKR